MTQRQLLHHLLRDDWTQEMLWGELCDLAVRIDHAPPASAAYQDLYFDLIDCWAQRYYDAPVQGAEHDNRRRP